MSEHGESHDTSALGRWTPGADEAERFREDLYLRIVRTAETMNRILDERKDSVLSNLRKAEADGKLHEERADYEMAAFSEYAEHSRYTYNWAHVMLTTRMVDGLKRLSSDLAAIRPKCKYPKKKSKERESEVSLLRSKFAVRFNIAFANSPTGESFLEGMACARNKIVHNRAMVWEESSLPVNIVLEGANNEWSPSKRDQDFVTQYPEYVDSCEQITVTEALFNTNADRAMAFVKWVGEQVDSFVRLLSEPSAEGSAPL